MSTESAATFAPEAERVAAVLRDQIVEGARARLPTGGARHRGRDGGQPDPGARRVADPRGRRSGHTPTRTWAVVRTFTTADIEELIEVRSALETLAFRRAAERGTADQLAELGGHLAAEQGAVQDGDGPGARRAAADFHETVVAMASNRLLSELFASTGSRIRWLLGQHSDMTTMATEHAELYGALLDRDAERAQTLAEAHLVTSRRAILEHRAGQPPTTE